MHVVITGASTGIGAATARRFAKAGCKVILLARRLEKLQELQKEIGSQASFFELDVTCRKSIETLFDQIDPIDVLINNAGAAFGLEKAQDANLDDWEKNIDVNIKGLTYCTHSALVKMIKKNKGHIVNLGSVAGSYPYPGGNVYCGSKAFVRQFSLCLLADLLGTDIRVSCIEPGLTGGTEFSKIRFRGDEKKANSLYEKTKPLMPEDIAEAIYFCVSAPPHVNINTMEIMPVSQAFAPLAVHSM